MSKKKGAPKGSKLEFAAATAADLYNRFKYI